jgi:hypothetical protein
MVNTSNIFIAQSSEIIGEIFCGRATCVKAARRVTA